MALCAVLFLPPFPLSHHPTFSPFQCIPPPLVHHVCLFPFCLLPSLLIISISYDWNGPMVGGSAASGEGLRCFCTASGQSNRLTDLSHSSIWLFAAIIKKEFIILFSKKYYETSKSKIILPEMEYDQCLLLCEADHGLTNKKIQSSLIPQPFNCFTCMVISRTAVSIIREKMSKRKKVSGCSSSNLTESESRMYNEKTDCPVPKVSCMCKEVPLPTNVDGEECGVRMRCTNDNCNLVKFLLHEACFEQLEQNLLKILSSRGSARGWTSSQLRCNLWERKGLTLIKNEIPCRCGKGLMSRDVEFYKKHELEIAKKSQQLQIDNRQRKKKKNKLPLLNFNSNVPVSADLLQNGFSGGISRRMSYGQCSHSSSAPLFYGQALLSESESDFAYDLRRTSTPAPCKSKLIVEKPKPLSDDRPNSKTKIPGLQPMVAPKQRKSQSKLSRETAAAAAQKNAASAKEKQQQQRVKAEEEAKLKDEVDSSQEIVLLKREEEEMVVRSEPTSEEGEQQQQVKSGRQYTLFGTPGFFLGELLMADAKLPRLLLPHRYNSGSCGQTNVEGVEMLMIKMYNYPLPYNI